MRKKSKRISTVLVLIILIAGYGSFALLRSLPPIKPVYEHNLYNLVSSTSKVQWPLDGESAVGVVGTSILETHGAETALPTASTAKMITALMILKSKPLTLGDQGPAITIGDTDVDIFNKYVAEEGSVVPVSAGEQISEYQMLEGMLVPSANNFADSLATWAYGSLTSYSTAANAYLTQLGLTSTHIGIDASGFDPSTTSTPSDLVKIGEQVLANPVLAQIVAMPSIDLPQNGTFANYDTLLGKNNIIGIKTGNSDQDLGAFVGGATVNVDGQNKIIVTANMDAPDLNTALTGSLPLISSAQSNFTDVDLVNKDQNIAYYYLPWSKTKVYAVAANQLESSIWGGSYLNVESTTLDNLKYPATVGTDVGTLKPNINLGNSSTMVQLSSNFTKPTIIWRLLHP